MTLEPSLPLSSKLHDLGNVVMTLATVKSKRLGPIVTVSFSKKSLWKMTKFAIIFVQKPLFICFSGDWCVYIWLGNMCIIILIINNLSTSKVVRSH